MTEPLDRAGGGAGRGPASAADASGQLEVLRALLDAVERLDAPYREAIVLRFLDELPPRAFAQRLELPVNTLRPT